MADKGFFGRLFSKDTTDPEVKALKERLDNIIGEQADLQAYDAKFIENEPSAFNTHFHADFSGIDQQLDMAALQRVYCTETWVYTAVSAIAKTIAGLPIKLEKRKTYKKTVVNDITGESEEVEKEIWLDACGDKLFKVFQYPNKYTTRSQFLMLLVIDLLTTGNYYIYLDSDEDLSAIANNSADDDANSAFGRLRTAMSANTKIKGMYRIPPALIKPVPSEDKGHIEGYVLQTDKGMYAFDCAEIIHVQLPNPTDPNVGLAPLIPAFKPVLLDRFSTEHMIRFYKSGARLGGIIETEKSLSKEQLGRFQRSFEANFTGRHNHHRTLILPPGMKYNQVAQNPAETALLDFCKYNQQAILSTYNVPPIKVGILEHANYANALAQLKIFFTDTIMPYLTFIEDGFNMNGALMPDNHTYRIKFDLSNVEALQENLLDKSAAAKGMLDSGLTVNEVRELVWKKGQIVGGDKAPVLEKLNKPEPTGLFNLAAPKNVDVKDAVSDSQADTSALSSIKPTSSTFSERVSQLVEQFMKEGKPLAEAIALAIAQAKTEGFTDPEDPNRGPEGGAPKPTEGEGQQPKNEEGKELGTNVPGHGAELVPTAMGGDKCPSCGKEQCECPKKSESDKDAKVPTLAEFLSAEIAKLEDDQEITADIIASLKNQYAQLYSGAQVTEKEIVYGNGFSKDMVVEHWKGFIEKTNPLIERRAKELEEFFAKYKRIVMNRYGGNLKTFGSFKARNEDDTNDILNEAELGKLIDEYIANIDKSLADAMKQGYADTLVEVEFGKLSDKDAVAALRQFALKSAKSVNETTREQLKTMLNEMFERGDSVQDIGKAINEKFAEINMGRVMTIARTEVLTAVSMGKAAKITHWQEQFPDKPLKKMWITAQDDRVRDSHKDLEGVSVDVNDAFPNGLLYPRDPGADDAGEVINCRCDFVTYAAEDQALMEAPARDVPGEDDEKAYDPDQPRDESGRWTSGGSSGENPRSGVRPSAVGRKPREETGEGYDRPPVKLLGPERLEGGARNNFKGTEWENDSDLTSTKGKEVSKAQVAKFHKLAQAELVNNVQPRFNDMLKSMKDEGVNIVSAKMRAKDVDSLTEKMHSKWSDKTLNQVTDGIGGRIVVGNMRELDKTVAKLERLSGMKIVEHVDYNSKPKDTGYRATHVLVKTPSGMIMEMQIKTQNQDIWSRWSHDDIYKNSELKDNKEIKAYSKAVSEYVYQIDLGKKPAGDRPEAPKILKDRGLEFPWDKINENPYD